MSVDISVILPTFNRKDFIIEAIRSVLNQLFRHFELIIIDDGSTDGTGDLLKTNLSDARISYHFQENRGVSAARNAGIALSKGDFIAFIDSDDLWKPEKLKMQLEELNYHPDHPLCHTQEKWLRKGKHLNQLQKHEKKGGWIFEHCLSMCRISPSSVLMKRHLIDDLGLFDESLPVCEDYDLWLRITAHFPVSFLDEVLVIKRGGHADQLSKAYPFMDYYRLLSLKKLYQSSVLNTVQQEACLNEMIRKAAILMNGAIKHNNREMITKLIALQTALPVK